MNRYPEVTLHGEDAAVRAARQVRNGANWFYWIAGLSAVNSVLAFLGIPIVFVFGLAVTGFLHFFLAGLLGVPVADAGWIPNLLPVTVAEILVALSFVAAGRAARRGFGPAFVVGGLIYLLDAGLCLVTQQWLMLAFHALALWYVARGYHGSRTLRRAGGEGAGPRRSWRLLTQSAAPAVVFAPVVLLPFAVLAFA